MPESPEIYFKKKNVPIQEDDIIKFDGDYFIWNERKQEWVFLGDMWSDYWENLRLTPITSNIKRRSNRDYVFSG